MKKILILLFIGLLIFPSCKVLDIFKKDKAEEPEVEKKSYEIKVPVVTSKATKSDLIKYIKTNGVAESSRKVSVYSEISGTISSVNLDENSLVKKGDILVELDTDDLDLQLQDAKITYNKALSEFNAWKKMENTASEEQLKIQTGLAAAEIQLARIKLNLEKSKIIAPFSGIVTKLNIVEGEKISTGNELFTLIDNSDMEIKGQILESELHRIKENTPVRVRFAAIPDGVFAGRLESISPEIDQINRTCEVIIKLDAAQEIKDGMFCEMKIQAEKYADQILIHKDAILVRNGRKLVFAVDGSKAKWQYVEIGEENDRFAAITDGVSEGQDIVIDGNFSLAHDALVNVKETVEFTTIQDRF